jgi:excisionase family DNA binding protein
MQAYATAQLTPLESESRLGPGPSFRPALGAVVGGVAPAQLDTSSAVAALVSVILDGLSDYDLGVLARRLLPHLRPPAELNDRNAAYTVASLATEVGVSQKTIRCAIARRELVAVKRGARWLISADAVREWATPPSEASRQRRGRCAPAPKAAGVSLRSVLCAAAGNGGRR